MAKIFIVEDEYDIRELLQNYLENEGMHIAPELLPHLFEPFFRGDPSRIRRTGGSGFGLYLAQMGCLTS